ncbi:MAG: hypothetical protein KGZ39_03060, partial [Simkania sp.]|nr:hypothetical protein [Simkania sp.]
MSTVQNTMSADSSNAGLAQPLPRELSQIDQRIASLRKRLLSVTCSQQTTCTDTAMLRKKSAIETRLAALKGDRYQDPKSLLDQASKQAKK